MPKALTVGELKIALAEVPDCLKVKLRSDTGVDQGEGEIIIEDAKRIRYPAGGLIVDYFSIYANDQGNVWENDEEESF